MDKTSQKVTKDKDPKRVDAGGKSREYFMKIMKENILNDGKKGGRDTTNSSNETTSVTNTANTRSNDTYVYSVGIIAAFGIGVCVFFGYNTYNIYNKWVAVIVRKTLKNLLMIDPP